MVVLGSKDGYDYDEDDDDGVECNYVASRDCHAAAKRREI